MKNSISKNELIERLRSSEQLSSIFPSMLIFAKQAKNRDLEQWILLEMNGYLNSNPAITPKTSVPEYRKVFGQYHDIYNRPLIIIDPKYDFISEHRLRDSIIELEHMAKSNGMLSMQDATRMKILKDGLNVEVHSFDFSAKSIFGILECIRTTAIEKIIELKSPTEKIENQNSSIELQILHPEVKRVAQKLFEDGHYRQALLDTYIHLVDSIKTKSGRRDCDGVMLMQTVFSVKNPIIRYSKDADEQLGIMWLFQEP